METQFQAQNSKRKAQSAKVVKFKIQSTKSQTNSNDQNSKFKTKLRN